MPVGVGIGTAAGGLIAAAFGWRTAFFVVAAPGVLLAAALLLFGREPQRAAPSEHRPVRLSEAVRLFAASPRLMGVSVAGGLGAFTCYGLMAWLSAYLIRVLGMTLGEIGSRLSITLAIGLGAGIWASGALADRFGPGNVRTYALIPAVALGLGAPAMWAATHASDQRVALPLFGLTLALSVCYLAPTVTIVQKIAPAGQRSTAGALLLLCLNLIGLGGGPWLIGVVSDLALPAHGTQSLRVAFYALAPMFLLAAAAYAGCAALLGRSGDTAATSAS